MAATYAQAIRESLNSIVTGAQAASAHAGSAQEFPGGGAPLGTVLRNQLNALTNLAVNQDVSREIDTPAVDERWWATKAAGVIAGIAVQAEAVMTTGRMVLPPSISHAKSGLEVALQRVGDLGRGLDDFWRGALGNAQAEGIELSQALGAEVQPNHDHFELTGPRYSATER